MNRLVTINQTLKPVVYDYLIPKTRDSEYVVDDSNFLPISEALKQLNRIADPSAKDIEECYDFPQGQDTGMKIPIHRQANGMVDICEISNSIMEQADSISDEINKGQKEAQRQVARNKRAAEIKAEVQAPPSSASPSN